MLSKTESGCQRNKIHRPTYKSWWAMKDRCTNKDHPRYSSYGGRGISVCSEWLNYESFVADMGERPDGTTLDRINVNECYSPGNCRWSNDRTQRRNKRSSVMLTIGGKTMSVADWSEVDGAVSRQAIYQRVEKGWPHYEAVFAPYQSGRRFSPDRAMV